MRAPNVTIAAEIVAAYVANNSVSSPGLSQLIADVHAAVDRLGKPVMQAVTPDLPQPAVSVKKSVTPDFIICLDDGKKFKSLKRHLRTTYKLSPDEYRAKWGLPKDYPMVAPNYAAHRSTLAKASGLGQSARTAQARKRGKA